MTVREQIGLTCFAVGIPVLVAWCKIRLWDFLAAK